MYIFFNTNQASSCLRKNSGLFLSYYFDDVGFVQGMVILFLFNLNIILVPVLVCPARLLSLRIECIF